ncbi:MAG: GreA/GreB family elongation factor, partial [Chloroflexi bacterium]|nr:GreA/GreB family elongation factor [Chloroflexota bacterium]
MATRIQRPAPLTDAGRARLREELDRLQQVREPQIAALMHEARDQAGAAEEGDFMALQEDLIRVQGRIQELQASLAAERAEEAPHTAGIVSIGSKVSARDNAGREHTFVIVSPVEADASRGHISAASPIGAALIGRKAGDEVNVKVPAGVRAFAVLNVA